MRREVRVLLVVVTALLGGLGLIATAVPGARASAGEAASASATATATATTTTPAGTATATATGSASTTATPTATATATATGSTTTLDDVQLRWGVNDETNNIAYFGANFLSAGKLPNKGANHAVTPSEWSQRSGDVSIEKWSAGAKAYRAATWAGLTTDTSGAAITSATSGRFSGHQVVLSGGTGTIDAAAGEAEIRWTGSFTVAFYSGYSFFYVTDPVLRVRAGHGVLTATLGGFGSSQANTSVWAPLPDTVATLADLGQVDLTVERGFTVTPAYRGVAVTLPAGTAAQDRTGATWGSFPQSFVDFQAQTGLSSFWYSSGVALDANKVAAPLTVSLRADDPVVVAPTQTSTPAATVTNPVKTAPAAPVTVTATATTAVLAPPAATAPAQPGGATPVTSAAGATLTQARPVETVLALRAATAEPAPAPAWPWLIGGAALLAAALLLVRTFGFSGRWFTLRRTTHQGA
ncbi:hypothetical protein [Nocardioides sp.]|uniref:hypothetical protein n=1 Tax=Nocardioides sp. TaxID=35761 RepID=UPI0026277FC7|nr:hypothetical protein [Nocardioides sp.]